ncbi:GPW/gp25 family protein [Providencia alcalifaciens]|uniref:GPW/gp25 family protein n=1 Tax=Providencia alcalifaciens TaxID=126385 RepID=UPI0003E2152A|nr:GPW/gp25 family protein [Providencia alcalifaciens]ETT00414.1 putative lysozyme [Providencia alcalifaciens PAL-3]EUC98509.1 putative lysozyme [Providencia alcalifaciens PAL-1]
MKYQGMNRIDGKAISDIEHIRQSISDILITPIGSRIARRAYGSLLSALIDQPQNPALKLQLMSTCYTALMRWEPRILLTRITLSCAKEAQMVIEIDAIQQETNQPLTFSIPVR